MFNHNPELIYLKISFNKQEENQKTDLKLRHA